jgi:hypothetical protein
MDDHGETFAGGDFELTAKCLLLRFDSGGRSGKIEASFPDGSRRQMLDHSLEVSMQRGVELLSKLRMQAKSEIDVWMSFPQRA